jgi:hypothetical protein
MLFIVLSGIVGAGATLLALWPYGAFSAFLVAPFSRGSRPCGWAGGRRTAGSALPLSGSRDYQRTVRPTPFDHRDVREAIVAHQLDVERK